VQVSGTLDSVALTTASFTGTIVDLDYVTPSADDTTTSTDDATDGEALDEDTEETSEDGSQFLLYTASLAMATLTAVFN